MSQRGMPTSLWVVPGHRLYSLERGCTTRKGQCSRLMLTQHGGKTPPQHRHGHHAPVARGALTAQRRAAQLAVLKSAATEGDALRASLAAAEREAAAARGAAAEGAAWRLRGEAAEAGAAAARGEAAAARQAAAAADERLRAAEEEMDRVAGAHPNPIPSLLNLGVGVPVAGPVQCGSRHTAARGCRHRARCGVGRALTARGAGALQARLRRSGRGAAPRRARTPKNWARCTRARRPPGRPRCARWLRSARRPPPRRARRSRASVAARCPRRPWRCIWGAPTSAGATLRSLVLCGRGRCNSCGRPRMGRRVRRPWRTQVDDPHRR